MLPDLTSYSQSCFHPLESVEPDDQILEEVVIIDQPPPAATESSICNLTIKTLIGNEHHFPMSLSATMEEIKLYTIEKGFFFDCGLIKGHPSHGIMLTANLQALKRTITLRELGCKPGSAFTIYAARTDTFCKGCNTRLLKAIANKTQRTDKITSSVLEECPH